VGHVVATDEGWLGRLVRNDDAVRPESSAMREPL
jgi:hypothetical protein